MIKACYVTITTFKFHAVSLASTNLLYNFSFHLTYFLFLGNCIYAIMLSQISSLIKKKDDFQHCQKLVSATNILRSYFNLLSVFVYNLVVQYMLKKAYQNTQKSPDRSLGHETNLPCKHLQEVCLIMHLLLLKLCSSNIKSFT